MEVIDARQAFFRWNEYYFDQLLEPYDQLQQSSLILVPLLFQTNHRLLPGYNGIDTPAGIYGYNPDKSVLGQAQKINSRFQYEQHSLLKNTIIEAIYLQRDAMDDELVLWVIHAATLAPDQYPVLDDKLQRVVAWLNSRNISCRGHLLTAQQLAGPEQLASKYGTAGLFLEQFYLQACLLAGKYPLWWLVPPEKEQQYAAWAEHLHSARYVNNEEYMDLGGLLDVDQDELLAQAIKLAQGLYQHAERNWLRLLLLVARVSAWPGAEGPAWRLKKNVYASVPPQDNQPIRIVSELIRYALEQMNNASRLLQPARMFASLSQVCRHGCRQMFQYLSQSTQHQRSRIDTVAYISLYKALFQHIGQAFDFLLQHYQQRADQQAQPQLQTLAVNMQAFLLPSNNRVPIYNSRNRAELVIGRMILRQQPDAPLDRQWSLVIEMDEGQQRVIEGFANLLALIAWAWLNRLVDQSTQISLDCPSRMVRQIEARHVLEVLIQQLDPARLTRVEQQVFEHPSTPMRSLIFTNLMASDEYRQRMESASAGDPLLYEAGDELLVNCEQLLINNWGDVYCQQYTGNQGVLQCLCNWTHHAELGRGGRPHALDCYGYAAGISTFWAQRIAQVYEELLQFFYDRNQHHGRFIIRMGPEFFLLEAVDGRLAPRKLGSQAGLYHYLEQANKEFRPYGLERYALTETPLRAIFERNREHVVQVFYQLINRRCYTWVLDEKGSLWREQQEGFDRGSYVAHWLYLMRNIRNRLKRINYQNRELPSMEIQHISSNQLGGLDFHPLGAEAVSGERGFIDIQVTVVGDDSGDKISLSCDGREFSYQQYQDRVITECVQYIAARMAREGRKPVYVTDIDVPLRLYGVDQRDAIQVSHFLKYKRNIEHRLNQLIEG